MAVDVIDISSPSADQRVSYHFANVNGRRYKYLYASPEDFRATCFLIHGWPDLGVYAWRYQVPALVKLGIRVICPNMMGYGGTGQFHYFLQNCMSRCELYYETLSWKPFEPYLDPVKALSPEWIVSLRRTWDKPQVPPESLALYGQKRASDDIKELARQLGASKIILGGHDWGGEIVYRCALWHPDLVSHVFSVCTPFTPPKKQYVSLEEVVKRQNVFGYQLQLAGPEVEARVVDKADIRQFLNGMYGARTSDGKVLFNPQKGLDLSLLPKMGKTKLLSDQEMDAYVEELSNSGLHGTCRVPNRIFSPSSACYLNTEAVNWYRTRAQNWQDELKLQTQAIQAPLLYIQANKDTVLLPAFSKGMEEYLPNLSRREVNASHWALWQAPEEVNSHIKEWIEAVVLAGKSKM